MNIKPINFDFLNSTVISYCEPETENILIIKFLSSESLMCEFIFTEILLFVHRKNCFSEFVINTFKDNVIFSLAISNAFPPPSKLPSPVRYKLFQFLDAFNNVSMEVVCKSYEFKIIESSL